MLRHLEYWNAENRLLNFIMLQWCRCMKIWRHLILKKGLCEFMKNKIKKTFLRVLPLALYITVLLTTQVLAALMTTVCVVGMKLSNNRQKVNQSVDWLKRIWIAWAIINGIGAFLAYVRPLLSGLNTITWWFSTRKSNSIKWNEFSNYVV